ncbi:MAG: hypothetical protein KBD53_05875 [Candidatus Omnitrophica bacterium]|nr:hypothetical protein [Candidatus Omnitrophota bacterium]
MRIQRIVKNIFLIVMMLGLIGVLPVEAAENTRPPFKPNVSYKLENKKPESKKESKVYSPQNTSDSVVAEKENGRADDGKDLKSREPSYIYPSGKSNHAGKTSQKSPRAYQNIKSIKDKNPGGKVKSFSGKRDDEAVPAGFETKSFEQKPFGPELLYKRFEEKDKKEKEKKK